MGASPAEPRVLLSPDSRASLARLVERAAEHTRAARATPALLARPLSIVAPHRVARSQLAARLVRACGHALAGVRVQSFDGFALETIARGGGRAPGGERLAGLLIERAARRHRALRAALDTLEDGFSSVRRGVSELVEAGLEAGNAEAVLERLADEEAPVGPFPARMRAQALVEVVRELEHEHEQRGAGGRAALHRAALAALARIPEPDLEHTVLITDGEVRGPELDLIEELARRGATVLLDAAILPDGGAPPPAPAAERLLQLPSIELPPSAPPRLRCHLSSDPETEARDALECARDAVESGVDPESIALVTVSPERHARHLRMHAARLGIPLHTASVRGGADPRWNRVRAALKLLESGEQTPASRLLDALQLESLLRPATADDGPGPSASQLHDLRLAVSALGLARAAAVAAFDPAARLGAATEYRLPTRNLRAKPVPGVEAESSPESGSEASEFEPDESELTRRRTSTRRKVPVAAIAELVRRTRLALDSLEPAPPLTTAARHAEHLRRFTQDCLGWPAEGRSARSLGGVVAAVLEDLPADLELDAQEWRRLIEEEVERRALTPFGGRGGGVQLLTADEARGSCFELTIVLGLERGSLPHQPSEDALLPDRVRERLREVLPELALGRERPGADLRAAASLLSSSPSVVLSRSAFDADGRPLAPSPLLARLGQVAEHSPEAPPGGERRPAAPLFSAEAPERGPRPAFEHWVVAGLRGDREHFAALAALTRAELEDRERPDDDDHALAEARAQVVELVDLPPHAGVESLGPYLGALGAAGASTDDEQLWATTLEGMARCAWQSFLRRRMGLEPPPDPLALLPTIDALVLGNVVHKALEDWFESHRPRGTDRPRTLADALVAGPFEVPPPTIDELERFLERAAREVVAEAGLSHPGLARVAIERARPMLLLALDLDWPDGEARRVLGMELEAAVELTDGEGGTRQVRFRADRVDAGENGDQLLIDYKSGKPAHDQKKGEKRASHYSKDLARGTRLQAMLYARAGGRGRYEFLGKPEEGYSGDARLPEFDLDDQPRQMALDRAGATLLDALRLGAFPPRLVDGKGNHNGACKHCEVASACIAGDSGARGRLTAFLEQRMGAGPRDTDGPLEHAWVALFALAEAEVPAPGAAEELEA
jgi:hypothetical protein